MYLKHVDLSSEGIYRCEVSGEEPDFATVEKEKEMKIYREYEILRYVNDTKTRILTIKCYH